MDEFLTYFSNDYREAREKFVNAAAAVNAEVFNYQNPVTGPNGESLSTDVARFGPPDAERRLLVVSGTHGAEGFCGSGIQVGLLSAAGSVSLPKGTSMTLVHAINPFGFAWLRRVNEDNIDLNRNFVDHGSGDYPPNSGYDELAEFLVPKHWDPEAQRISQSALDRYGEKNGLFALQAAISLGQYDHPEGLFYGGRAAAWSRRIFEEIVVEQFSGAKFAAFVDLHTGLGPHGYGEPICLHERGSPGHLRAVAWYGEDVTTPYVGDDDNGDSSSPAINGPLSLGCAAMAPSTDWTSIALEFGTQPIDDVIGALRADAWLHAYGDLGSTQGHEIKKNIRNAFYGDTPSWKQTIGTRGREIVTGALTGLSEL
jgi:hypothetical protein